jgi:hypothetical protein
VEEGQKQGFVPLLTFINILHWLNKGTHQSEDSMTSAAEEIEIVRAHMTMLCTHSMVKCSGQTEQRCRSSPPENGTDRMWEDYNGQGFCKSLQSSSISMKNLHMFWDKGLVTNANGNNLQSIVTSSKCRFVVK